ncbi:MAG: amidohydrolase family protein [Ferruginibacter sp.]
MFKYKFQLLFCLVTGLLSNISAQPAADIIITNGTIINIETGRLEKGKAIVLKNGKIKAVINQPKIKMLKNYVTINAAGKFIMPGLWDMHVHFGGGDTLLEENKNLLPLYIANGITAVRDAAADISPAVLEWRRQVNEGILTGPTIFTSGPKIEGINSIWIGDLEVGSVEEMKKAMDSLQQLKVDFIKITDNTLRPSLYLETVKEARKRGLPVSGHIPYALTMKEVVDAGLSSVEHMAYALKAGAANDEEIAAAVLSGKLANKEVMPLVLKNFDEAYAMKVYRYMAQKGTAVVPTLSISRITAYLDKEDHWQDDYLKYIGEGLKNTYHWRVQRAAGDSKEAVELRHQVFEKAASLLPLLHKAGVTIIAGTDAGYLNSFDYPGQGLHTELALLVKYGLTPLQALQSSAINGPRYFGLQQTYGRVAGGYAADLLILDKNPLVDISATQTIAAVFVKGKYFSRIVLDSMLTEIQARAATPVNRRK